MEILFNNSLGVHLQTANDRDEEPHFLGTKTKKVHQPCLYPLIILMG